MKIPDTSFDIFPVEIKESIDYPLDCAGEPIAESIDQLWEIDFDWNGVRSIQGSSLPCPVKGIEYNLGELLVFDEVKFYEFLENVINSAMQEGDNAEEYKKVLKELKGGSKPLSALKKLNSSVVMP